MRRYFDKLNRDNIVSIDEFISAKECKLILQELRFVYWQASTVVKRKQRQTYSALIEESRKSLTSHQEWFSDELNAKLVEIESRVCEWLSISNGNLEHWQATRYGKGDSFDYHLDSGLWKKSESGERVRTILLFLNTPLKGGATHFRALNRKIKAKTGRLLVWNNLLPNGNCNYATIHSGQAVIAGNKTTLVTWERQLTHRRIT